MSTASENVSVEEAIADKNVSVEEAIADKNVSFEVIDPDEDSIDVINIRKVLGNDILRKRVKLWSNAGVINLIQPRWKEVLYNNLIFKKHKEGQVKFNAKKDPAKHFMNHYIQNQDDRLNILVLGYFRVIPNTADNGNNGCLILSSCAPLEEIGKVLCPTTFMNNCKFYVPTCGGICPACRPNNIAQDNLWCMQNTRVFNRDGIALATRSYIEEVFKRPTLVIMRTCINMYYEFSKGCKIGGYVKNICFVQECLLEPEEENMSQILSITPLSIPNPTKRKLEEDTVYALPERMIKKKNEPTFEVNTMKLKRKLEEDTDYALPERMVKKKNKPTFEEEI